MEQIRLKASDILWQNILDNLPPPTIATIGKETY
jgi:hypothetical protein